MPVTGTPQRATTRADFERLARSFAHTLRPGDVVTLCGELGAGKTTFVAAAVDELQGGAPASSPTFLFWQRYPGPPAIEHLDFYRIERPEEAIELGLHEAFESGGVVFIEWPERLPDIIPPAHFRVAIEGSGDAPRTVMIEAPR